MSILSLIALPHPLNLLHNPPSKVLGHEDRELAAVAEDGVEEVVGGIAAEGEERGVGRILALRGMEGLGEQIVDFGACGAETDEGRLARAVVDAEAFGEELGGVEVLGRGEGLVGEQVHGAFEAVEGEGLELRLVVLLGKEVPAPFVELEGVGAQMAAVGLGIEAMVGGAEATMAVEGIDDGLVVLHALGRCLDEDSVAHVLRLVDELADGEARDEPVGEARLVVVDGLDVPSVVVAAIAGDDDAEDVLDGAESVVEGAFGQGCAFAEVGLQAPVSVDLDVGELAMLLEEVDEPEAAAQLVVFYDCWHKYLFITNYFSEKMSFFIFVKMAASLASIAETWLFF